MGIEIKSNDRWPKVFKEFDYLNHHCVAIGILGYDWRMQMIAHSNEYGVKIVPKNGQSLAIPTENVPKGNDGLPKSPKQMDNLYRPKGKNVLMQNDDSGQPVLMFILVRNVTIPPRPFIRRTMIKHKNKYQKMCVRGCNLIAQGKYTGEQFLNILGQTVQADMRQELTKLKDPPNKPITIERKGSSNSLIDTGELRRKIQYEVRRL